MTGDLFTQGKKQRPFNAFEFMKMEKAMQHAQYEGGPLPQIMKIFTSGGTYVFNADSGEVVLEK